MEGIDSLMDYGVFIPSNPTLVRLPPKNSRFSTVSLMKSFLFVPVFRPIQGQIKLNIKKNPSCLHATCVLFFVRLPSISSTLLKHIILTIDSIKNYINHCSRTRDKFLYCTHFCSLSEPGVYVTHSALVGDLDIFYFWWFNAALRC